MLLIIAICCITLWYEFGDEANFKKDTYYEVITGIAFTTITVFIISIFNWMMGTKEIHELQREYTLSNIMDLLIGNTPGNNNIISELYTTEATNKILRNIATSISDVIREDLDYEAYIYEDASGDIKMDQNICYKRHFKLPPNSPDECYLNLGFAFNTESLNKLFEENIYFFREEITDVNLIQKLTETVDNKDTKALSELINLKITIILNNEREQSIPSECLEVDPICLGDAIIGFIVKTKVKYEDKKEGMRSYCCRITFTIPAPEHRRFYCIFADPSIGSTQFKFRVSPKVVKDINDIDFVEIITRAGNGTAHIKRVSEYVREFRTKDAILPKSAIIAFW